jgi:hypothetical protein
MPRIEKTTGVSNDKVEEVMDMYRKAGAEKVEKVKENGTWTVIATFP